MCANAPAIVGSPEKELKARENITPPIGLPCDVSAPIAAATHEAVGAVRAERVSSYDN